MARDLQRLFRLEARDLLGGITKGIAGLESGPPDGETVRSLLRLAHTLKGAAGVVGQPQIAALVHDLEESLPQTPGAAVRSLPRLHELVAAIDAQIAHLEREAESDAPRAQAVPAATDAMRTLRVDVGDLERLEQQLYTIRTRLAELRTRNQAVERVVADVEALQASLEAIRLVPVATAAEYLERSAAEAAASLHKLVRLDVTGGDLRIELHVLVAVRDALVQAVRNAVAHGIEAPQVRSAAGKPREGRIEIAAERRGSWIAFSCRDDGRGVDVTAVRELLVRAGRLSAADERAAPDAVILDALMRHRVTSRPTPSPHAGRGLGLDVIRDVATRLRGRARCVTDPGAGTTVEILVPAGVSSLAALRVQSGEARALLPLDAVRQVARFAATALEQAANRTTVLIDGEAMPFVSLSGVLATGAAAERESVAVVIGHGAEAIALGTTHPGVVVATLARRLPFLSAASPVVSAVAEVDAEILPLLDPRRLRETSPRPAASLPGPEARRVARILVVDDSITTRMLEQSILESAGYDVDTVASGEEGLDRARQGGYDILVVDVEMPGMNGFEFLELVRATPTIAHVPAILVTSRDSAADRRRARDVGAREYFVKSAFDQDRLLDAIRGLVG